MATVDRIEQMLNRLGSAIPSVIWERDAADVLRPEDWGAAELRVSPLSQWADGEPTDTAWGIDLYLCVSDREADWQDAVESVLRAYDDEVAWITWELKERSWRPEIQKTLWRWRVTLYEALKYDDGE